MPRPKVAAYRYASGPSITWLTTVTGRFVRDHDGVPVDRFVSEVSTMPRSVPRRTRPALVMSMLSAGTSGRFPLTSFQVDVEPVTVTFHRWPAAARSLPGPSVQVRLYPPNTTYALLAFEGSGVTQVIMRFGTAAGRVSGW